MLQLRHLLQKVLRFPKTNADTFIDKTIRYGRQVQWLNTKNSPSHNGVRFEDAVEAALKTELGCVKIDKSSYLIAAKQSDLRTLRSTFGKQHYVKGVPYIPLAEKLRELHTGRKSFYATRGRNPSTEFVVSGIRVECKTQVVQGTAKDKILHTYFQLAYCSPEADAVLLLAGDKFDDEYIKALKEGAFELASHNCVCHASTKVTIINHHDATVVVDSFINFLKKKLQIK